VVPLQCRCQLHQQEQVRALQRVLLQALQLGQPQERSWALLRQLLAALLLLLLQDSLQRLQEVLQQLLEVTRCHALHCQHGQRWLLLQLTAALPCLVQQS
jgi:hypothetical protein